MEAQQKAVEDAAAGGKEHTAFAIEYNAPIDYCQNIEEGKNTVYTSSSIDNGSNEKGIYQQLKIGKPEKVLTIFEEDDINKRQKVYCCQQEKVGILYIGEIGLGFLDLNKYGSS
jgi:hypothetical protein